MKKLFVLLFPQIAYLGKEWNEQELYNQCIGQRYLQNGYEFAVASFKSPKNEMSLPPAHRVVEANITFEQSSPYFTKNWMTPNFKALAHKLNPQKYSQIIVGGFHCYDCVKKFAMEIYKLNNNVIVDTDLTELFFGVRRYKNWQTSKFDPDLKLSEAVENESNGTLLKIMRNTFAHPIWGISKDMFAKLDAKISNLENEL